MEVLEEKAAKVEEPVKKKEVKQPKKMEAPTTPMRSEHWSNDEREAWIAGLTEESNLAEIDKFLRVKYKHLFDDISELKAMDGPVVGEPMNIELIEGAEPFAIGGARSIPFHLRGGAKDVLDYMLERRVITPVGDVPTPWLSPMVAVAKPCGGVRVCVDYTKLNAATKPTYHPALTPQDAVSQIPSDAQFFAKIDLRKGYWQMGLTEEASWLTTFATPWGKFRFLRAPMGHRNSGDAYSYRGDVAFQGIDLQKLIDDLSVAAKNIKDFVRKLLEVLERCHRHSLTINGEKSTLAAKEIEFVGYKISPGKIEPDRRKLEAIECFPAPTTRTELRSFMGLPLCHYVVYGDVYSGYYLFRKFDQIF